MQVCGLNQRYTCRVNAQGHVYVLITSTWLKLTERIKLALTESADVECGMWNLEEQHSLRVRVFFFSPFVKERCICNNVGQCRTCRYKRHTKAYLCHFFFCLHCFRLFIYLFVGWDSEIMRMSSSNEDNPSHWQALSGKRKCTLVIPNTLSKEIVSPYWTNTHTHTEPN